VATTKSRKHDIVVQRAGPGFVKTVYKNSKPSLSDALKENTNVSTTPGSICDAGGKSDAVARLSVSAYESQPGLLSSSTCSPRLYRVMLSYGDCLRPVLTQMCIGQCRSYTVPRRSSFVKAEGALGGFEEFCKCCSVVQKATKRQDLTCNNHATGRKTRKSFFVPFAKKCSCRPCQR
jgi:hypothetical protein